MQSKGGCVKGFHFHEYPDHEQCLVTNKEFKI